MEKNETILTKFEIVKDAPRLRCKCCGNYAVEMGRCQANTPNRDKLFIACTYCGNFETISKADWEKVMEF